MIRRDVYDRDPWVAASLFEAFRLAKHAALERLQFTGTLAAMVPWLFAELEAAEATLTGHYWPYGVDENRAELEAMLRDCGFEITQHYESSGLKFSLVLAHPA